MVEAELHRDDLPARRVDEIVTVLMVPILDSVAGKRRRRLQQAQADLRACIDATGETVMSMEEKRLLDLERQFFGSDGAVARVAPAPVLLLVLPSYLEDDRWQGPEDEDKRVRMRLGLGLARATSRLPELEGFDITSALADVERAWRVANRRLRRGRGERALAMLSPDQRASFEELLAQIDARRASEAGG